MSRFKDYHDRLDEPDDTAPCDEPNPQAAAILLWVARNTTRRNGATVLPPLAFELLSVAVAMENDGIEANGFGVGDSFGMQYFVCTVTERNIDGADVLCRGEEVYRAPDLSYQEAKRIAETLEVVLWGGTRT